MIKTTYETPDPFILIYAIKHVTNNINKQAIVQKIFDIGL